MNRVRTVATQTDSPRLVATPPVFLLAALLVFACRGVSNNVLWFLSELCQPLPEVPHRAEEHDLEKQ